MRCLSTSDRRSEPIGETLRTSFVVDRGQVDAEGARTLSDALVGVPGVELVLYGAFRAEVDLKIRGATSARTLVAADKRSIAGASSGTVDFDQFSAIGAQRIAAGVRGRDYGDRTTGRISANLPLHAGIALRGGIDATSLDLGVSRRLDGLPRNTTNCSANVTALIGLAKLSTR